MKLPFHIDLSEKVVVITGAGGVICSTLAKAVGACGAKVALLDLNKEAAQKWADEIVAEGGIAKRGISSGGNAVVFVASRGGNVQDELLYIFHKTVSLSVTQITDALGCHHYTKER